MARGYGFRRSAPRAKRPTAAQIAASEKAWNEADGSFIGRAAKGEIVVDYTGQCFRVTRGGRRYHEDADNLSYPLQACRAPKDFATCERLRNVIEQVLRQGHAEPGARNESQDRPGLAVPPGAVVATWQDRRADSYASLPWLELHEGDVLRAVRPNYDDSPSVAWIADKRLAKSRARPDRRDRSTAQDRPHVGSAGYGSGAVARSEPRGERPSTARSGL